MVNSFKCWGLEGLLFTGKAKVEGSKQFRILAMARVVSFYAVGVTWFDTIWPSIRRNITCFSYLPA